MGSYVNGAISAGHLRRRDSMSSRWERHNTALQNVLGIGFCRGRYRGWRGGRYAQRFLGQAAALEGQAT